MFSVLLVPSSDEELDARLRAVKAPAPEGLERRLLETIPASPTRAPAAQTKRRLLAAGALIAALGLAAVLLLPETAPVSAEQVIDRMMAALDGKCLVAEPARPEYGGQTEWMAPYADATAETGAWAVRVDWTVNNHTVHRSWIGDRCFHATSTGRVRAISHSRAFGWVGRSNHLPRLIKLLERGDHGDPDWALELVGEDTVDDKVCHVISWHKRPHDGTEPQNDEEASQRVHWGRSVWWVGRSSHLPICYCYYLRPLADPAPSLAEARELLRRGLAGELDPGDALAGLAPRQNLWVTRFRVISRPHDSFFALDDLADKTEVDLRPAQDEVLAHSVVSTEVETCRVTVHSVESGQNGVVYVVVSLQPSGLPDGTRSHLPRLDSKGAVRMRSGRRYYPVYDQLFDTEGRDVLLLSLIPADLGQRLLPNESVELPLDILMLVPAIAAPGADPGPYAEQVQAHARVTIDVPAWTVPGDDPPDCCNASPRWVCGRGIGLVSGLPGHIKAIARRLQKAGYPSDALAFAQKAEELYAARRAADPSLDETPNRVDPQQFMSIYVDLRDTEQVRRYAELERQAIAGEYADVPEGEWEQRILETHADGSMNVRPELAGVPLYQMRRWHERESRLGHVKRALESVERSQ